MPTSSFDPREPNTLPARVFAIIMIVGGIALAVSPIGQRTAERGLSGLIGVPMWLLGAAIAVFGAAFVVMTIRTDRRWREAKRLDLAAGSTTHRDALAEQATAARTMSARSLTTIKYLGLIAFAVFAVIGVVRLVMGDGTGWWWLVGGAVAAFGVAMRYLMVKTTSHIEPDRAD